MNAVIYARYSSDSQREESIEGQIRECTDYANRNNIIVVGTYIDRAFSARTDDRPEFQRMIRESANSNFQIVLVWKLDRFSRDRYDSAHYKSILKKNGVKLVSAKEEISDSPEGIILESVLEGLAEYYSADLSVKIVRGHKENALKGKNNGGGTPFGYLLDKETQKLVIDPATAPIVKEIYEKYAEGYSIREIIDDLNTRGIRTKRGGEFKPSSFNTILRNRKYIGEYKYADVVIPGGVPAIISEELFNRVQAKLQKNRRAPAMAKADDDYILTTKLFCGKCGNMMVGECGTSHTGTKHYYYKCNHAKRKKTCDKKAVRKEWIEDLVVRVTMDKILDKGYVDKLIDTLMVLQDKEDVTLPALRRDLTEVEKTISNMLDAIGQGIFTSSTKQRLEELERRKEELEISIAEAEFKHPKVPREFFEFWFSKFLEGDPDDIEFRKTLIDSFVNAVYLYDDKIVLFYNSKGDNEKTITLKEIEEAGGFGFDSLASTKSKKSEPEFIFIKNRFGAVFYFSELGE